MEVVKISRVGRGASSKVCSESVLVTSVVFKRATIVVSRMDSAIASATVIAVFLGVSTAVVLCTGIFEG